MGSLHQFQFGILACTAASYGPALAATSGENVTTAAAAQPYLSTGSLVTGIDPECTAWLTIPPSSADDMTFSRTPRPASLRIWRVFNNVVGTLVKPIYQLGIWKPATFVYGTGFDGALPIWTPLSDPVTDSGSTTTGATAEQTLPITHTNTELLIAGYQRGQLVVFVSLPSAATSCFLVIAGGGWSNS